MEINAAIVREKGLFSLEKAELEQPKENEVLIKITACGMCHTDLAMLTQAAPFSLPLPALIGHEGAGVVERVGEKVTNLAVGDKVVLSFAFCGECGSCRAGRPAYCEEFVRYNFTGCRPDGSGSVHAGEVPVAASFFYQSSFATYAVAHVSNAIRVNDDAPLEILAPLGCGIQTGAGAVLNVLKPGPDNTLAVFGLGAVGLAAVMAARVADCKTIIAVDLNASRLELASSVGATHTINAAAGDVIEAIQTHCPAGVDCSVEATGVPVVVAQSITALNGTGTAVLLGVPAQDSKLELDGVSFMPGKTVRACVEGDAVPQEFIPRLVEYYQQGIFPIDKMVKLYEFDAINQAVADCKSGATIKPVLKING